LKDFAKWLGQRGMNDLAQSARDIGSASALGLDLELPGPVGERNLYALHPRGNILLVPQTETGLYRQMTAALATGNTVYIDEASGLRNLLNDLPVSVAMRTVWTSDWEGDAPFAGALIEGDSSRIVEINKRLATLPGPL